MLKNIEVPCEFRSRSRLANKVAYFPIPTLLYITIHDGAHSVWANSYRYSSGDASSGPTASERVSSTFPK